MYKFLFICFTDTFVLEDIQLHYNLQDDGWDVMVFNKF